MAKHVFISHAGTDSPAALAIAGQLEELGVVVTIDRETLRGGDSFLAFMEQALSACDYCLLLWSKAASEGKYVQVEWEAALYKTIEESRRFLLIARLEDYPVPSLLGPRLRVELFPDSSPGVAELVALLDEDAAAERASNRPVRQAARTASEDEGGARVYVTSELFGRTLPVVWDLDLPAGVHLDRLVQDMGLPKQQDVRGAVGVRYTYDLALDDERLSRAKPLAAQGVGEQSVLWLEVTVKPFAASDPVAGELTSATFRGDDAIGAGRKALLKAIDDVGLGF